MEPVDGDIMKRPPRQVKEPMLTVSLLLQVMCSAAIIVSGTLWIFWREVSILWDITKYVVFRVHIWYQPLGNVCWIVSINFFKNH